MSGEPVFSSQMRAYFFADAAERKGTMIAFRMIDQSQAGGLRRAMRVCPGSRYVLEYGLVSMTRGSDRNCRR